MSGGKYREVSEGSIKPIRDSSLSASTSVDEIFRPHLVDAFSAADILPSRGPVQISNFQCIASYNWLDSSEPVIVVPGMFALCYRSVLTEEVDC